MGDKIGEKIVITPRTTVISQPVSLKSQVQLKFIIFVVHDDDDHEGVKMAISFLFITEPFLNSYF